MSEMDPRDAEMERLLRRSMDAPVPQLSPDFHQALARELRRRSEPFNQVGRILLAAYGGVSGVVSLVVLRGQGLGWGAIAAMILGPLALVVALPWAWRATHSAMRIGAQ